MPGVGGKGPGGVGVGRDLGELNEKRQSNIFRPVSLTRRWAILMSSFYRRGNGDTE